MRKLYLLFVLVLALGMSTAAFAAEGDMATIELNGQPGYEGISGTATLMDNGDSTTMVKLELEGTPEGGSHPAHFHDGTSCDQSEAVLHPLENVEDGMSESTVEESFDELVEANYYLNVHLSAEEAGTIVACGDEYAVLDSPPDTGAGGLAGQTSIPVFGLGLVGIVLAAGALMVGRARSV